MDVQWINAGVASVSKRRGGCPHKPSQTFCPESVGSVRIEYVPKEKAVPNLLTIHTDGVEGTEVIERRREFFKRTIVQE
jgi:hypothetical protein